MNKRNSARGLDGLFTIQAWHAKFNDDTIEADLFVHVNFATAKMGGDADSCISFELKLRRATVIVITPEDEGFEIDLKSIARAKTKRLESEKNKSSSTKIAGGVNADLSNTKLIGGVSGSVEHENEHRTTTKLTEQLFSIKVIDGQTSEDHHCWHLEPLEDTFLEGTPWDVVEEPRLRILDRRNSTKRDRDNSFNMTEPTVVEIRCRREDLEIVLEPKNKAIKDILKFRSESEQDKRMAAAESYIRDVLVQQGLEHSDLLEENKYVWIQLSSIFAKQQ